MRSSPRLLRSAVRSPVPYPRGGLRGRPSPALPLPTGRRRAWAGGLPGLPRSHLERVSLRGGLSQHQPVCFGMILQPSLAKPSPEWSRPHPGEAGPTSPAIAGIRQLLEGRHSGSRQRREDGSLPQLCDFFRGQQELEES